MKLFISKDQNTVFVNDNEYKSAQLSETDHENSEVDCLRCAFRGKIIEGEKICPQIPCDPLYRIDKSAKFFELVIK